MAPRAPSVRKCAFPVLAINQASILQVTECETDGNSTDIESPTELMLARNWKGTLLGVVENFFGKSRH